VTPAIIEVRRAPDRPVTRTSWLHSRHSFSYGPHYDPANTHFGLLLASNEDELAPGAGFDEHPHRDVEVLTWVLSGALAHSDSAGHRGEARPGVLQRMSAGGGVRHAERAVGPGPAHYVQMWLRPDGPGGKPAYGTVEVDLAAGLVAVAPLRQPHATLHAGRLAAGQAVTLPGAPYLHVFVARGGVELAAVDDAGDRPDPVAAAGSAERRSGGSPSPVLLGVGDAARVTRAGAARLTAPGGAEVLAWEMRAGLPVG